MKRKHLLTVVAGVLTTADLRGHSANTSAIVSGNSTSFLQGALTVVILKA